MARQFNPSFLISFFLSISLSASSTLAYIPAIASNNTSIYTNSTTSNSTSASGLSSSSSPAPRFIGVIYGGAGAPGSQYRGTVEQILFAGSSSSSSGGSNNSVTSADGSVARGALVHFTEQNSTAQPPSAAPWIAFISCDTNGTLGTFSMQDDVFTVCRDRGASAALLYSTTSETCSINTAYLGFSDRPLNVYVTTSLTGSKMIEGQFVTVAQTAVNYDSSLLNSSSTAISQSLNNSFSSPATATATTTTTRLIRKRAPVQPYLLSYISSTDITLNPTASATNGTDPSATPTPTAQSQNNNNNNPNTGLAMIILYAITGVVTLMFVIVILSGAIRAIRHPERYGPRAGDPRNPRAGGGAQTRAGGLTRAILDTFPVVKFGRSNDEGLGTVRNDAETDAGGDGEGKSGEDVEARAGLRNANGGAAAGGGGEEMEMATLPVAERVVGGPLDTPGTEKDAKTAISSASIERADTPPGTPPVDERHESDSAVGAGVGGEEVGAGLAAVPMGERRKSSATGSGSGSEVETSDKGKANDGSVGGVASDNEEVPAAAAAAASATNVDPNSVDNKFTCPICVCEFEEGEDIRILPCDGKHAYHKDCIDPWLLNVSSLCPLCRWDLRPSPEKEASSSAATESSELLAGDNPVDPNATISPPTPAATSTPATPAEQPQQSFASHMRQLLTQSRHSHARDATSATTQSQHQTRFARYMLQVRTGVSSRAGRRRSARAAAAEVAGREGVSEGSGAATAAAGTSGGNGSVDAAGAGSRDDLAGSTSRND